MAFVFQIFKLILLQSKYWIDIEWINEYIENKGKIYMSSIGTQ